MYVTINLYRDSDILLYLLNKKTGCFKRITNKPNTQVKCGISFFLFISCSNHDDGSWERLNANQTKDTMSRVICQHPLPWSMHGII